jgi:hypothetical protein
MVAQRFLRAIPAHERVEFIFEAQDKYEPLVNMVLSTLVNGNSDPQFLTTEGISKLANWRFVPKDSTMLTQPADFFVYAVTQTYRDKKSVKSKLCMPICPNGDESEAIGAILTRNQVRATVEVTRTLLNWEMISGLDLKPKTPEERERFNKLMQDIINWRPDGAK